MAGELSPSFSSSPSLFHIQSRITLIILFLFPLLLQSHPATTPSLLNLTPLPLTLSVVDFGAVGDGVHYDTAAIQSAIDACQASTSTSLCHVTFPPGSYLTATVRLKSGVVLDVQEGATILGGTRISDYPSEQRRWYVVLAENATDVGITGGGVVDGQGLAFVKRFDERKNVMLSWNLTGACSGDECRPRLVGFIGCKNVQVWNVRLTQPAYWWCALHSPPFLTFNYFYAICVFSNFFNRVILVNSFFIRY